MKILVKLLAVSFFSISVQAQDLFVTRIIMEGKTSPSKLDTVFKEVFQSESCLDAQFIYSDSSSATIGILTNKLINQEALDRISQNLNQKMCLNGACSLFVTIKKIPQSAVIAEVRSMYKEPRSPRGEEYDTKNQRLNPLVYAAIPHLTSRCSQAEEIEATPAARLYFGDIKNRSDAEVISVSLRTLDSDRFWNFSFLKY